MGPVLPASILPPRQLLGLIEIKVKEAAVKPDGKVVDVLRVGRAVDILQADNHEQYHHHTL